MKIEKRKLANGKLEVTVKVEKYETAALPRGLRCDLLNVDSRGLLTIEDLHCDEICVEMDENGYLTMSNCNARKLAIYSGAGSIEASAFRTVECVNANIDFNNYVFAGSISNRYGTVKLSYCAVFLLDGAFCCFDYGPALLVHKLQLLKVTQSGTVPAGVIVKTSD